VPRIIDPSAITEILSVCDIRHGQTDESTALYIKRAMYFRSEKNKNSIEIVVVIGYHYPEYRLGSARERDRGEVNIQPGQSNRFGQ
jgi:hypothetical protein